MKLAVYGTGGQGREIYGTAKEVFKAKEWNENDIFFVVDDEYLSSETMQNTLSFTECVDRYDPEELSFVISIGTPKERERLYYKVIEKGYDLMTLIHPKAEISNGAKVGRGSVIQCYSIVSCDAEVGENCIMNGLSAIGHDSVVGNHTQISAHVGVSGYVNIGEGNYIGPGVIIKDRVSIGDHSIIGMGSMVFRNIPNDVIAMGNPARPMKRKEDNKEYYLFK